MGAGLAGRTQIQVCTRSAERLTPAPVASEAGAAAALANGLATELGGLGKITRDLSEVRKVPRCFGLILERRAISPKADNISTRFDRNRLPRSDLVTCPCQG